MSKTPTAKTFVIAFATSKEFLSSFLLHDDDNDNDPNTLKGSLLNGVMDQYTVFSSPNIHNIISSFRFQYGGKGYVDNILELKKRSKYDIVQESVFLGQGSKKNYLFKMSVKGPWIGVNLVERMQPGGSLENAWLVIDHVERVKDWNSMACHVYDSTYCKVMNIAICDMQSEDTKSRWFMWYALNCVMANYNLPNPNFKGLMADSAQAN